MKKPGLGNSSPLDERDSNAVRTWLETIGGRRGEENDIKGLEGMSISNPPTQAQVVFLRQQLIILCKRLQE